MSFRDVKPLSPKAPKPREVIVRFRVTEEEYAAIQDAAEFDGARFEAELLERGLPKSAVETLKRPSEWMRYIVMKAANPTAEEARRKRVREAEQRAREAEESKARFAREAERTLERFITDTQTSLSPFLNASVIGSVLEQAETGRAALEQLEQLEKGGALAAIKQIEQGGALAAIKEIQAGIIGAGLKRR